jgi:trigger factor
MQVTQTLADGLKREFKVVVAAADLASRADAQLEEMKDKVRINGFRPGKVPVAHLRRLYGRSVMADIVNTMVGEANRKIVDENHIKLAMEPKLDFEGGDDGMKAVLQGTSDVAWTVKVEVLPSFEIGDVSGIKIEKPVALVADAEVDGRLEDLARRNVSYSDKKTGATAAQHDRVVIDFTGKIAGEPFEGGDGTDISVDIGSNSFISGFEEQLIGAKAGEHRIVNVTFPGNYLAKKLAGQSATFEVTVKAVQEPGPLTIDEALAKSVGIESLDKLKETVRRSIERDYAAATRRRVKRQLLDALDEKFRFDLPPTLVEQEFTNVWRQVEQDMKASNRSFEDEKTTEEAAKEDYRKIAARRVRLGLVLAEIGEKNNIQVSDEEVARAVVERARQFPGQEQQVWEFYRKTPAALAEVRAPLFEDKVVDYLLELAKVTEKTLAPEELLKDEEEESGAGA